MIHTMLNKFVGSIFIILTLGISVKAQVGVVNFTDVENRIAKGKDTTYVINLWATWCGPCVEELPAFEKVNQQRSNKPLKVILLSLDFKSKLNSTVVPFIEKHKIKSEVFIVDEKDQQKFIDRVDKNWSGALPATLVINTAHNRRSFYEKSFTYEELVQAIANTK
jgi:thiol-disulfide isomerase/thioredoxin